MRLTGPAAARRIRLGLRARLALIYGGSFLVAGVILTTVLYALVARAVNARFTVRAFAGPGPGALPPGAPRTQDVRVTMIQKVAEQRGDLLADVLRNAGLTLIALCVLATVLGYLLAGRTLRPLHTVTATARRLSESNLHERIGLTGPRDEIKELADTFDAMLNRLHRAFDSQRRFIANASHELRTPLAITRTAIEVALAKPAVPEETRALAAKLLPATSRHERLIEGLLLLARSEREVRDPVPVDLRDAAETALGQLGAAARDAGLSVTADLGAAPTSGDPILLERCVVNLVENAVKYNLPGGAIRVHTGTTGGRPCLLVENTGPPVTPAQAASIFDPFTRLRSRVGGSTGAGLGLSIVRAITEAHAALLHTHPHPAGGLTITLQFPPPLPDPPAEPLRAASV